MPFTLEDLQEFNPTVGKGLADILAYEDDDVEDTFCLTFVATYEFFGATETVRNAIQYEKLYYLTLN
jgi:hypothetical protein